MIRGHEAIVRDDPPTQQHVEYPKHMTHPGFQPGVGDQETIHPNGTRSYVGGRSIRFPPVLVMNADQQAYQESQGYEVQGKSNPAAFANAMKNLPDPAKQERIEYPKWVGGVLCNSAEEEAAAAEKRRVQLGIVPSEPATEAKKPDEAGTVASAPPVPPDGEKTADQLRIEALEAQIAEMKAMFAAALGKPAAPDASLVAGAADVGMTIAPTPLPDNLDEIRRLASAGEPLIDIHKNRDAEPEALSHGQKIAAGRARKAAERAAQQAAEPGADGRNEAA